MKDFYSKDEYNFDDILSLIENEVEESIFLDFKDSGSFEKTDGKKKEISKDVSSFSNSEGGIIIYGVREYDHKAHSMSFIDGREYTKEWLEQVLNSTIQRRISGIEIFPIRKDGDLEKTLYVVKIPKSIDAPHLSKDRRFYKRFNFESVMMEEYEIRQSYGRRVNSKLVIDNLSRAITFVDSSIEIEIEGSILNVGEKLENEYKLNIYFQNVVRLNVSWDTRHDSYDYTRMNDGRYKISSFSSSSIYPNELCTVLRFKITVDSFDYEEVLKDVKVSLRLYYSDGEDELETDFDETITKIRALIQEANS